MAGGTELAVVLFMRAQRIGIHCLAVAMLAACGGSPPGDPGLQSCVPACAGKSCGPDACGGTCGICAGNASCTDGVCVERGTCSPLCAGKVCGDDGCGGICGTCASGATCVRGSCASPSPGCPGGGTCTYLERTAWSYDCTSADQCQRKGAIATYGAFEACQTWGCMGGNSRCGDQFGNDSDPDRWSCERCKVSCHDGTSTACTPAAETSQGCGLSDSTWGPYLAACICQ